MARILAVDLDDTIFPTVQTFCNFAKETYGLEIAPDDFFDYDFKRVLCMSQEDTDRMLHEYYETQYFIDMAPMSGALESLLELREMYSTIAAVTSREPNKTKNTTYDSLDKHLNGIFDQIHFGYNPFMKKGDMSKLEICTSIKAEALIDDYTPHFERCSEQGVRGLLIHQKWNENDKEPANVVRVHGGMTEVPKYILNTQNS